MKTTTRIDSESRDGRRPPASRIRTAAAALAAVAAIALAGCGGGGGGVGAAGSTDPRDVAFRPPAALEPIAGGAMSSAVAVNAGGTVVGLSGNASREVRAARWRVNPDNGAVSAATALLPLPGNGYSAAYAVNDNGTVVGESGDASDNVIVAVLWAPDGTAATRLPAFGPGSGSAYGIGSSGRIVGEAANGAGRTVPVYWSSPTAEPVQLALLPGGTTGAAYFVGDDGTVVGESENGSGSLRAVRWKIAPGTGIAGAPDDLGTLPGHARSVALGVNRDGIIVGESESAGGELHSVSWKAGLLPGSFDVADLGKAGADSGAAAINDDNRIVGWSRDDAGNAVSALWHALSSPSDTVNTGFAGTGAARALSINRSGMVVGTKEERGFAVLPR